MLFNEYFEKSTQHGNKLFHNYLGISKKEYPRWQGWKIITAYRARGVDVKSINDVLLDTHVRNFYYTKYLNENF